MASRSGSASTRCSATARRRRGRAARPSSGSASPARLTANSVSAAVAEHRRRLERGHRALARHVVGRRVGLKPQHGPAPVARRVHEREEARLPPRRPAVERADRRDDVDELGQARDLDAVGVAQQRDQQAADDERVGHRLVVLRERRRVLERAGDVRVMRVGALVPDVPLVHAQADALAAALAPGHRVGGGDDRRDHAVEVERAGQVGVEAGVVGRVVVGVQRDVVGDAPRRGRAPCPPTRRRSAWGVRAADHARARSTGRRAASPCPPRRPGGRTRPPSSGRSATARPSRCPGTTAGSRTGRDGRWPRASRRSGCRRARCSTRRGCAPRRRPRVPRLTASIGSTSGLARPAP